MIGQPQKVEGFDLGIGEAASEQRPHRASSLIHIGNAARRPIGNAAHEIQRRSHPMLRQRTAGLVSA
jgi:hypothetical protein